MNIDWLYEDLAATAWNPVFSSINVNDKIDYFNNVLQSLQNRHAPLLPVIKKSSLSLTKPWFNNAIKRAIIERDLSYTAFKNGLVTRLHYTQLRNAATNLIKKAKANYLQPKLDVKLGSKAIWQNLRSVGVVSSNKVDPCFTADDYNRHLASASCHRNDLPVTLTPNPAVGSFFITSHAVKYRELFIQLSRRQLDLTIYRSSSLRSRFHSFFKY